MLYEVITVACDVLRRCEWRLEQQQAENNDSPGPCFVDLWLIHDRPPKNVVSAAIRSDYTQGRPPLPVRLLPGWEKAKDFLKEKLRSYNFV